MYDAESERTESESEESYNYHVLKSTVYVHPSQITTIDTDQRTPDGNLLMPKMEDIQNEDIVIEAPVETEKAIRQPADGQTFSLLTDMMDQLMGCIERNSEVMQVAMETMDSLSRSSARNPVSDDGDLIIPDSKRSDKVTVEIKCTFLKITDIDTIDQQFEAEIFVQAKWQEPILEQNYMGDTQKNKEGLDKMIPWDPKLIVMNIDGAFVLNRKTYDIRYNEPGYRYPLVVQLWRFKGFFKENLELEHFPVDVQDLTISISTERSDAEVDLVEDQTAVSSINTKSFMDQAEWSLYNHIETFCDFTTVEYCSSTVHPILHAQCRVARKMGYFIWNIVFIMLLIISLTFAAYSIEFKTADRLTVTITLFLTAVAFKLVVKQSLPTISYLTYLDVYVISALIFLGLQAAQNASMTAMSHFMAQAEVQYFDKWSMVSMAFLLVMFHVIFAVFIYRTASKRRRVMKEKDRMYAAKRDFLEKFGELPPRYDKNVSDRDFFDNFIPGRSLSKSALPK